jgi:hypothetical protein
MRTEQRAKPPLLFRTKNTQQHKNDPEEEKKEAALSWLLREREIKKRTANTHSRESMTLQKKKGKKKREKKTKKVLSTKPKYPRTEIHRKKK